MANILTDDQRSIQQLIKDFMTKRLKPRLSELDEKGEFPLEIYQEAFELGLHCLDIPEEFGGAGMDAATICIALEEIAKTDAGFGASLLCTGVALQNILRGGTTAQKQHFADIIVPGAFGSFCLTEPGSGSDSGSISTTATREGDHYIINGTKCFVTNAEYSSVYIVLATTDRTLGSKGITAFFVERDTPGLCIGKHENKMGLRLTNTCEVVFGNVMVPASHRLGQEGEGFRIAMGGLDTGRVFNAALAVGLAQAAIDEAVDYAKVRKQFGKPIIVNQGIQFMLADMQMGTEAARQLVRNAAALIDGGVEHITMEASIAKAYASDNAMKVTTDAVQIFGGYGYIKEYPVEKMMRDAKIFQIFEGTNQIQRMIIAREMAR